MTTCQGSINTIPVSSTEEHRSGSRFSGLREVLRLWSERARRRHELRELLYMPEHLLKDMGISREDVYREYRKPFWRA